MNLQETEVYCLKALEKNHKISIFQPKRYVEGGKSVFDEILREFFIMNCFKLKTVFLHQCYKEHLACLNVAL